MLKVIFPILSFLLLEASKTESENGVIINSVKLKYNPADAGGIKEGSNITLTCSVDILTPSGQSPQISYLFYKGQTQDVLLKIVTIQAQESQYLIQSARPSHSGYYSCEVAAGSQREESASTFITVTGNLQTPVLTVHPIEVILGDLTELCCTSEEIPPLTFIFYTYKNGLNPVRLHENSSKNKTVTHQLRVTTDTEKNYSCTIEVPAARSVSKHSEVVQLSVQNPFSDPMFEIEPSNEIFEGDKLTIKCRVTHLLPHVKPQLIIMKDTTPISTGNTSSVVFSKTANATDTGKYGCMARWNSVSQAIRRQVTVAVPVSIPTLMSTPIGGNVVEDGSLDLSCAVLGGSYPITYKFYQDTSEIPLHQITLNATTAVHHIVSVKNGHSGKYSCEVSNSANQITRTKKSQYVTIIVRGGGFLWWIYIIIVVISLMIIGLAILIAQHCKQWCKNNEGINQEDESSKPSQRGPLQHNQGSLKKSMEVIYSKIGNITHPKLNQPDSDMLIEQQEADSDRNHEGDYTNIMSYQGNVTEDDSESDCEADYTNVTSKRKAASADSDTSSDETNHVLYTQLDLAALQNNSTPQPQGPTIYASIALDKLR
ncbi:platelet endothelial cell adhesion molecule-like isoform X7 [Chiloscyllium plagiosum]|uniref:platelet endothelial cell adhesion molecule-like isoform X7 n=1 Tax=Chiloscyllium plagiosum TaxID=36176 RepID=UPI001CB86A23|nr:platelet endothelial cell adhesion molecule-like isoform X7 [Chiloscyllium plagiosum]